MNRRLLVVLGVLLLAVQVNAEESPVLKTQKDKVYYAIGVNMISNLKQQGIDVDLDLVIKGMKDATSGGKLLLNDEELRKSISIYQTKVRQKNPRSKPVATEEKK